MSNIVIVFTVINSIYAVLATRLYGDSYPQKFGSFFISSFSMFQVATGEGWVTDITWYLYDDPKNYGIGVLLFFSSYTVMVGIILFNIIVAVLLEGFLGAIQDKEREERDKLERQARMRQAMALDPLLATLANFSSPSHLSSQIKLLFQLLDVDDSCTLSFSEIQQGMEALPLSPKVILSIEDWDALTINGSLLDDEKCMDAAAFATAIRWQLMLYGQRLIAQRMTQAIKSNTDDPTSLFAMKLCLMQVCSGWGGTEAAMLIGTRAKHGVGAASSPDGRGGGSESPVETRNGGGEGGWGGGGGGRTALALAAEARDVSAAALVVGFVCARVRVRVCVCVLYAALHLNVYLVFPLGAP
jgi:hypothetical protein